MCGIAGFVGGNWPDRAEVAGTLARMGRSIRHRGPDHSEVWIDENARVGFAHNRLAILDLSPAGNQPMASFSGRYVIAYNGERRTRTFRNPAARAPKRRAWNPGQE